MILILGSCYRHQAKRLPTLPTCDHGEGSIYRCKELSLQDVRRIHQRYYKDASLEAKKNYILQHVTVTSVTRKRLKNQCNRPREGKKVSTSFTLPKQREGQVKQVRVCRAGFLHILQEGRDRVQRLCQRFLESGVTPPETRGGPRQIEKYSLKRESVKEFIKSFIPIQNHYCRGSIRKRQYLPSELSIKTMWEMYLEQQEDQGLRVEYEFFRTVFNESFNVSFNAPYTDKCSTCMSLENKILGEVNAEKKNELKAELIVHKKRADVFFCKLRNKKDNEITLSYDCQKNLILPKVPDQEAYYRRQLYLYNFTVCEGDSNESQTKENTTSYLWTEDEFPKGSIQIASALHHKLSGLDFTGITTVRLFSDGCGGQNKNTTIIFMLSYWLLKEAPNNIKEIELCFPIVGHSFIPPDRVFGNLERQFKKQTVIENPGKYLSFFETYCTVIRLGLDCPVLNWKLAYDDIIKITTQWHFQFQKSKKIVLRRNKTLTSVLVRGELFYNTDTGVFKSLCKRGKSFNNVILENVPKGVIVKKAKISDVKRLLMLHFGENWERNPNLKFYIDVFQNQESLTNDNVADDQEDDFELMVDELLL